MDKGRKSRKIDFIPERLKQAAKDKNMTLLDVANSIEGLEYETLRYYTKTKKIMPDWLAEISSLLEVNPGFIAGTTDEKTRTDRELSDEEMKAMDLWFYEQTYPSSFDIDAQIRIPVNAEVTMNKFDIYALFLGFFDFPRKNIEELRKNPTSGESKQFRWFIDKAMHNVVNEWEYFEAVNDEELQQEILQQEWPEYEHEDEVKHGKGNE